MRILCKVSLAVLGILISLSIRAQKFTIIAMPDTQHYTDVPANESNFAAQTQWITDNRDNLNIVFVTGLGDIVQNPTVDAEWQLADAAYDLIEDPVTTMLIEGIPYGLAVGNHDMTPVSGGSSANTDKYNEYFGEARYTGRAYYGGHYGANNDNNFQLFSASGLDFIIIHFEYDDTMESEVLDWADSLLTVHSDRRAILTTHNMVRTGIPADFSGQGQAIYSNLSEHENVFLMLGGHVPGEGRRDDVAINGNTITSLLSDYQSRANGGDGFLRIMEFSPDENLIRVKTYSPVLNQYGNSATMGGSTISAEFTVNYPMSNVQNSETIVFQDGVNNYSGTSDSYLWDVNPEVVRGAELTFIQDINTNDQRTSLLSFDISGIPAGSTINSATLTFNVDTEGQGFNMHRMLTNWDEGSISFTSNMGHFLADDIDAEVAINANWPGDDNYTGSITVSVLPATIQDWLDGNMANNGWLMLPTDNSDGQQLSSRESGVISIRPKLTINYDDPSANTNLSFQEGVNGYGGTEDTYIWNVDPTLARGNETNMVQDINVNDERRTLLKFDLESVPAGAVIQSVRAEFRVSVEGQGFTMHEMLKPWTEATTYSTIGEAHYEADNVDAKVNVDAEWPGNNDYTGIISVPLSISTIQNWVNREEVNNGWLLKASHPDDGQQLNTSENGTVAFRPKLIIEHIACPVSTTFDNGEWSNGSPCSTSHAIFMENYYTYIYGNVNAKSIEVEDGVEVVVATSNYVKTWE